MAVRAIISARHPIAVLMPKALSMISVQLQSFTTTAGNPNSVLYVPQELTEEQQAQARENIGIVTLKTDETLSLSEENVLSVNTAPNIEENNTLPITAAAVYSTVGNIEILLETI